MIKYKPILKEMIEFISDKTHINQTSIGKMRTIEINLVTLDI